MKNLSLSEVFTLRLRFLSLHIKRDDDYFYLYEFFFLQNIAPY